VRGVFFGGWRGGSIDHVVQRYHWHGKNLQFTRPANESVMQVGLKTGMV
jgi:hypothetical protein